jgi:hypothetical protein
MGDEGGKGMIPFDERLRQVADDDNPMMVMMRSMMDEMKSLKSSINEGMVGIRAEVAEVKRVAESAGSQASAANETIRSLSARVMALEKGGLAGGSEGSGGPGGSGDLGGSAARRGAGSAPPTRGDPVAKVVGFPKFTLQEEIEEKIDAILKQVNVDCADRFGVGRRGDYGLVVFQDQGKLQEFLKMTDGKMFNHEVDGEKVDLKVTRKGDPVWLEATNTSGHFCRCWETVAGFLGTERIRRDWTRIIRPRRCSLGGGRRGNLTRKVNSLLRWRISIRRQGGWGSSSLGRRSRMNSYGCYPNRISTRLEVISNANAYQGEDGAPTRTFMDKGMGRGRGVRGDWGRGLRREWGRLGTGEGDQPRFDEYQQRH